MRSIVDAENEHWPIHCLAAFLRVVEYWQRKSSQWEEMAFPQIAK